MVRAVSPIEALKLSSTITGGHEDESLRLSDECLMVETLEMLMIVLLSAFFLSTHIVNTFHIALVKKKWTIEHSEFCWSCGQLNRQISHL